MDSKVFLGKYRVTTAKGPSVGEIADSPLAYEAEEIDSGKKVVVEVVPTGSLKPATRERLEAEAMAAKKLSHANIPVLHDFGVEDDRLIYVTEDVEGTLAEEWVNANGPMPVGPVLRIASQVVSALGAAAFHGINHQAINPGNLVLVPGQTAEGEWPLVKLLHFVGVAPKFSGTDVAVAAFDKSLHYASPEQLKEGAVDFRSELYSLGATMWFLLTGAPPLVAPAAAAPARFGVGAEKINALPKKVRRLLSQMLAVNPEARPADLLVFDRQLQDCLHRVERRETVTRRLGIPSFSFIGLPGRRVPAKTLAFAALFLAIATVAALVVSGRLRHERIVRAEEPIGKPIGVAEISASPTPVTDNTSTMASNTAPSTTTLAETNAPPPNAESSPATTPAAATESLASVSTTGPEVTPAPPPASDSPKVLESRDPDAVLANNAATLPDIPESHEVTSSKPPEPTPGETHDPAAGHIAKKTAPEKTMMHEVRRAQPPDDEPTAANTEPAPPAKGPESSDSKGASSDSDSRVPGKSLSKPTEQTTKPKRQTEKKKSSREHIVDSERARPLPAGARRARVVGQTPEGWLLLELPSGRIIVVPPPPSAR